MILAMLENVFPRFCVSFPGSRVIHGESWGIRGGDLHTLVLDRQGRVHSTGQGIHGVLGRGGLASTGEELDFREAGIQGRSHWLSRWLSLW